MGKRKRRADPNKASTSDVLPHSSQMDPSAQQDPSPEVENNASTPIATILELVDGSVKLQKVSQLPPHQHRLSRVMFLRNPSLYARKYSRRNTSGHADASTSHANVENDTSKTANRSHPDVFEQQTESSAGAIQNQEEIRLSPLSPNSPSRNAKNTCRICEKLLKKKPQQDGHSPSHIEPSVVAVLVCGHAYHADCLEKRTCHEERMDPSCPVCRSPTFQGEG